MRQPMFQSAGRARNDDERILPLINIIFLLLIFFMLAGQLQAVGGLEIDPAVSTIEAETGDRDRMVELASDGRIALDGESLDRQALAERLAQGGDAIWLKADRQVEATEVVRLMELFRDAGIRELHLMTVEAEQ
tara:strand:+ start:74 stop:475 length:402 start_codon:yes stop_codon:yes gene_type:complete